MGLDRPLADPRSTRRGVSGGGLARHARAQPWRDSVLRALSLIALPHFTGDEDGAYELVERLEEALAPGSYLVMSHLTPDFHPQKASKKVTDLYRADGLTMDMRSRDRFARFFEGLEVVTPGIVAAEEWHPEPGEAVPGQDDAHSGAYVAVARKA